MEHEFESQEAFEANYQSEEELMMNLAKRVSLRRRSLRLSIKDCATRAGLSARYLIQVEAGSANLSMKKLSHLCRVLELRPAELLSDGERGEIDQLLSSLQPEQLAQALVLLRGVFQVNRPTMIALLGVRGAGKSSVGHQLAERLAYQMIELDEEIEKRAGLRLNELFSVHGESYYRRLEGEVLQEIQSAGFPCVIATGGSIVTHSPHFTLVKSMCKTVYLKASATEHMERVIAQGDQRPMRNRPQAMAELERLLSERAPLYQTADHCEVTSKREISELVDSICEWLSKVQ